VALPIPRVVVVTRSTPYEALVAKRSTRGQAEFFLRTRKQRIEPIESAHQRFRDALARVLRVIPAKWRRANVARSDLDRFLFEPEDIIVVVGQDGLVANVAKYLDGQLVIGINPLPDLYDGVLVPHPVAAAGDLLIGAAQSKVPVEHRTMVQAQLEDGQRILALNEVFIGHRSHQSARYRLIVHESSESHSSSGVIVATGTGSTGWARSIHLALGGPLELPTPTARTLTFFVREAFPSIATQVSITRGLLDERQSLDLISEMDEGGVIFGDGIEDDHLDFARGQRVKIQTARESLSLVRA